MDLKVYSLTIFDYIKNIIEMMKKIKILFLCEHERIILRRFMKQIILSKFRYAEFCENDHGG